MGLAEGEQGAARCRLPPDSRYRRTRGTAGRSGCPGRAGPAARSRCPAAPRHGSAAPGSQSAPRPGPARLHSFIHKKKRHSAAGKRALPGPPPRRAGHGYSRQSASSLLSEQSSSSSHFQMAGMHRSFRHWNWFSSHSLTAPARHGAAPGSAGRAPTAGRRGHPGAASQPSPAADNPGKAPGAAAGQEWGLRLGLPGHSGSVRAGAGLAGAQRLGETRLGGSTAAIPKLLCAGIKKGHSCASPHCFKGGGKRSLGTEDG